MNQQYIGDIFRNAFAEFSAVVLEQGEGLL
jgi:hypothetical protein